MRSKAMVIAVLMSACAAAFAMRAPERIAQNDNSNPDYSLVTGSKKCIGLYFDVMDTTPSNILANADQFAANTPYLDGVAIGLRNIVVESADGSIVTTQFHRIMSPRDRWTREAVKDQIPYLKEIVKKPCLKESLLLFWMSPTKGNRIDWTDDKGWANFAENMASVAWLAKVSGLKGLLIDPEEYGAQGGQAPQYVHTHLDPPYETCANLARQRGREVFSAIYREFPDAVVLSLWFMSKFDFWLEKGRQMFPRESAAQSGELMQHFMNGILDVLPEEARIVDGFERYTGSAVDGAYLADHVTASTTALSLVEPENIRKFRSQVYFSSGHYLEMYAQTQNPNWFWYFGPVNGSRLEHLRLNMEQAFRSATEYVWLYGERAGKLFNWRDGHYAKQKTWEEVIPGLTETMMLAKDPLGYAAMRKAELSKNGKLTNLVKEQKSFTLGNTTAPREFHQPLAKMTSFKVNPSKRYGVIGSVEERGPKKNERLQGLAIPRVFFRKDGVPTGEAVPLQVHYDRPKVWQGATPAAVVVDVPAGADELVCDFGANLKLGERVTYWTLNVYELSDASAYEAETKTDWWSKASLYSRINRLCEKGYATRLKQEFNYIMHTHKLSYVTKPAEEVSVKGVKSGELYSVGMAMKRIGPGYLYIYPKFRGGGKIVKSNEVVPQIAFPRRDGRWQTREIPVRVPEGADEIYFDITADITEDSTLIDFKDFSVIKIGDPLPVWPAETLREKKK